MLKIELKNTQQLSRLAVVLVMALLSLYLVVMIGLQLQTAKIDSSVVARVAPGKMVAWTWFGRQRVIAPVKTQTDLAMRKLMQSYLALCCPAPLHRQRLNLRESRNRFTKWVTSLTESWS